MVASGNVEAQVVISETAPVIEAKSLIVPVALRNVAVDAARWWVYKPAMRDGVPVRTESVLTFTFTHGDQ